MSLAFNNTPIEKVTFNGTNVENIFFNGAKVWEDIPAELNVLRGHNEGSSEFITDYIDSRYVTLSRINVSASSWYIGVEDTDSNQLTLNLGKFSRAEVTLKYVNLNGSYSGEGNRAYTRFGTVLNGNQTGLDFNPNTKVIELTESGVINLSAYAKCVPDSFTVAAMWIESITLYK